MMHEGTARFLGRSSLSARTARALLGQPAAQEAADRLIRLARLALRAPVATLGRFEPERLRILSQHGVPEPWARTGELPLDASFCRLVRDAGDVIAIDDAARNPLAAAVRPLEGFPRGAYCGSPVRIDGATVAVLAVLDAHPRRWTPEDIAVMRDLPAALLRDLELLTARPDAGHTDSARLVAPESLHDGVIVTDAQWRCTLANGQAQRLLGRGDAELMGRSFWQVFPALTGTVFHHEFLRALSDQVTVTLEEYCPSLGIWLELRATPTVEGGVAIQLRDVSERRAAQEELRNREARYRQLFEESHTPLLVMTPDARLVEVNRACERLLGRDREQLYGLSLAELMVNAAPLERALQELRAEGVLAEVELELERRGEAFVCALSASVQVAEGGVTYHGALRDITALKQSQEALLRSALHEPLTGLPNRAVFTDRLERLLRHAQRHAEHRFAVLFIDLDSFKAVNDTFGHLIGDELLIEVARRLEACLRQEDTVARIGGDEFGVLLDAIHDAAGVAHVVERIRDSLAQPFGHGRGITASIGVALSMTGYEQPDDVLRDADTAMYRAKQSGRNGYVMFDADMQRRAQQQQQLEHELRAALAREQLAVHYHPIVELERGAVTGLEALIRWAHPERGILLPAEFMALAEQTGLIVEIGWWILRQACRQLKAWQLEYPDAAFSLTMSVNLSAKQFVHPGLVTKLDEILAETQLDPRCLRLDLTEAVMAHDSQLTLELVRALRARGIQLCIDDFGTGLTSLRQLRAFQVSTLKIDRSLIDRLGAGGEGTEIVQTIVALGRSMAIDAVAEGVETLEQLEQLRSLGLRFAQGFLFSLPLDTHATTRLLQERT